MVKFITKGNINNTSVNIKFNKDKYFKGILKNESPWTGKGCWKLNSNNFFEGEWKNGLKWNGKIKINDSKYELDGIVKNGNIWKGKGKIIYNLDKDYFFEGEWKNGIRWNGTINMKFDVYNQFNGILKNGKYWKGNGVMYSKSKTIESYHNGEWNNGFKDFTGKKRIKYGNGRFMEGYFENGKMKNGKVNFKIKKSYKSKGCTCTLCKDNIDYIGDLKDFKPYNGKGKFIYQDNSKAYFIGEWKDGVEWKGKGVDKSKVSYQVKDGKKV